MDGASTRSLPAKPQTQTRRDDGWAPGLARLPEKCRQYAGRPPDLDGVSALSNRGTIGLDDVSLRLRGGEIVGVAGVSGNGQQELAQCITGLREATAGSVVVDGNNVTNAPPSRLNEMGLSYIPEERMIDGVIKEFSVAENYVCKIMAIPSSRPPKSSCFSARSAKLVDKPSKLRDQDSQHRNLG